MNLWIEEMLFHYGGSTPLGFKEKKLFARYLELYFQFIFSGYSGEEERERGNYRKRDKKKRERERERIGRQGDRSPINMQLENEFGIRLREKIVSSHSHTYIYTHTCTHTHMHSL